MKIGNWFKAFEWAHIVFGTGHLDRFIVFENKYLGAIYFNRWNVVEHDRFHTHAFPSFSLFVRGYYYEEQLQSDGSVEKFKFKAPYVRFISRTSNHRMLNSSPNAWSITIAGAWDRMWSETFLNGAKRILTWGRGVVIQEGGIKSKNGVNG